MLTKYVTDNNWRIVDYYIDDGIRDNYERSGKRLDDVKRAKSIWCQRPKSFR